MKKIKSQLAVKNVEELLEFEVGRPDFTQRNILITVIRV